MLLGQSAHHLSLTAVLRAKMYDKYRRRRLAVVVSTVIILSTVPNIYIFFNKCL